MGASTSPSSPSSRCRSPAPPRGPYPMPGTSWVAAGAGARPPRPPPRASSSMVGTAKSRNPSPAPPPNLAHSHGPVGSFRPVPSHRRSAADHLFAVDHRTRAPRGGDLGRPGGSRQRRRRDGFVTVGAPFGKLLGTLYVLMGLHLARPPRHLRRVFVLVERLTPWSMIEVFVFGVLVAYVKLGDLVTISLGTGVFALFALTFVMVWADSALDREAVWDALDRSTAARPGVAQPAGTRAGDRRDRLRVLRSGERAARQAKPRCPRCDSLLHAAQAEQPRADLGAGDRGRHPLCAGQPVSGADGDAAWRRRTQHDPRRRARADFVAHVSARGAGVLCQHRRADAEARRPDRHAGRHADRPRGMAARPDQAVSRRALDRPLVDDRHLHGIAARGAGAVRQRDHHRARHRRGRVLRAW